MDRAFESFGENPDRSDAFGAMIDIYVRLEEKLRGALPRLLRELEVTRRKDEGGGGGSGAGGAVEYSGVCSAAAGSRSR